MVFFSQPPQPQQTVVLLLRICSQVGVKEQISSGLSRLFRSQTVQSCSRRGREDFDEPDEGSQPVRTRRIGIARLVLPQKRDSRSELLRREEGVSRLA
ncbi:unnamed protein product, partial [Protopolystoma xenopodis]